MTSHFKGPGYEFDIEIPEGWRLITVEEHIRYSWATSLLSDLDRCEHGRHKGDVCGGFPPGGCNGPSQGNSFLQPGQRIGTTISGNPITVPRIGLGDPTLWIPDP